MAISARPIILLSALLSLSAGLWGAPPDDLAELVSRLPADCVVVVGTADLGATVRDLRRWVEPSAEAALLPMAAESVRAAWDDAAKVAGGPAVVGVTVDGRALCLLRSPLSLHELGEVLQTRVTTLEEEGALAIGEWETPDAWVLSADGLLAASNDRALAEAAIAGRAWPEGDMLDGSDLSHLVRGPDAASATAFGFVDWDTVYQMLAPPARPGTPEAAMRRVTDAFQEGLAARGTALATLKLGEDGVVLRVTVPRIGDEEDGPPATEFPGAALPPGAALALRGTGADFAAAVDAVAYYMAAVDPDIGAEFQQEMSELDDDLGFGFQRDLLANLGPDWQYAVLPPAARYGDRWRAIFGVRDASSFVAHARRLAEMGGAPWAASEGADGVRRFTTETNSQRLEIAVTDRAVVFAENPADVEAAFRAMADAPQAAGGAAGRSVTAAVNWPALAGAFEDDPEFGPLRDGVLSLPAETRTSAALWRASGAYEVELRLTGISPEQLAESLWAIAAGSLGAF